MIKITKKDINIELYLLCFNEEKMILHTLNYYSQFCNKIIVINNDSTDNSLAILNEFKHEDITVKRMDTGGELRDDIMIYEKNNCWKESQADYVIVCDMDEFLYGDNILETLYQAKQKNIIFPAIAGYNMMSDSFPNNYNELITSQVRYGFRDRRFDKSIIFSPKHTKEINYSIGAHGCNPVFYTAPIREDLLELKLLHYKYLDKEYMYKKHDKYAERMSELNKVKHYGYEYLLGSKYLDSVFSCTSYLTKIL